MTVDPGDLTDVRSNLQDLADEYEGTQFANVINRLETALSGDELQQYESADFTSDPIAALEEAANEANLSQKYSNIFQNATNLRQALAETARKAFDDSAREMLSDQAEANSLDRAYTFCARGEFDAAAEAVGLDDADFDHAADCKHSVATQGYAQALFKAYREEGDDAVYTPPATPTDPNA